MVTFGYSSLAPGIFFVITPTSAYCSRFENVNVVFDSKLTINILII